MRRILPIILTMVMSIFTIGADCCGISEMSADDIESECCICIDLPQRQSIQKTVMSSSAYGLKEGLSVSLQFSGAELSHIVPRYSNYTKHKRFCVYRL